LAIIDDHAFVIDGLQTMLRTFPHLEVAYTTQCGSALLQQLQTALFDVLLMDIQKPEINGIDWQDQHAFRH